MHHRNAAIPLIGQLLNWIELKCSRRWKRFGSNLDLALLRFDVGEQFDWFDGLSCLCVRDMVDIISICFLYFFVLNGCFACDIWDVNVGWLCRFCCEWECGSISCLWVCLASTMTSLKIKKSENFLDLFPVYPMFFCLLSCYTLVHFLLVSGNTCPREHKAKWELIKQTNFIA